MTKLKIGILAAVMVAALATWLALQHQTRVKEREAEESKRQRQARQAQEASARSKAEPTEAQEQEIMNRMVQGKATIIALARFAKSHQGKLPASLEELELVAPETEKADAARTNATFEIAYQGSFKALGALPNAREIVVLRQKEPLPYGDGWAKVYGYGDGHFEVRKQTHRDFTAWEQPRTKTR